MNSDYKSLQAVEHTVLAFYETGGVPGSLETIFDKSLGWLKRVGCPPHLMATDLDKKLLRFKNSEKKARQGGFVVGHFSLISVPEGLQEWEGKRAFIYYRLKSREIIIDFETSVVELGSEALLLIAQEACRLTNPQYGIGYRRSFGQGPWHYAVGIILSHPVYDRNYKLVEVIEPDEEEQENICGWNAALHLHLLEVGLIRDVYPWNFLTAPHLERRIGNCTLREWIRKEPRRGRLLPITDQVTLWEVDEKEIAKIRRTLFDANVIFDWEKHRDAPLEMFNVGPDSPIEGCEFFQAWASKTPEEMKRWFRAKYGCDKFPSLSPAPTVEEVRNMILQGMGVKAEEVRILKVEKPGQVRELSTDEVKKAMKGNKARGKK